MEVRGVTCFTQDIGRAVTKKITQATPPPPLEGIENVSHFLAGASRKGGVGKTSLAVNLARALQQDGFRVGLLDADVNGPSIPVMLDLKEEPNLQAGMIAPLEKFGLKLMSMGFMVDEAKPVIWRGPMVSKAIRQLFGK
jgi:ATP-binding protein involved in chromosome partitioning